MMLIVYVAVYCDGNTIPKIMQETKEDFDIVKDKVTQGLEMVEEQFSKLSSKLKLDFDELGYDWIDPLTCLSVEGAQE